MDSGRSEQSGPSPGGAGAPSPLGPNEQEALVAGCRAGDRTAQRRLYELFASQIYNLILRIVRDRDDAFDLTQDALLRAFASIGTFRKEASLRTWLYRIAVNEARMHLRKTKRRRQLQLRVAKDATAAADRNRSDDQMDITWALDRLEPDARSILILRYQQGLSYGEIAEVLGVPSGTVGSRLNRARQAITELLGSMR